MALDTERTRKLLQSFDFKTLFVEELGWDHYTAPLVVPADGQDYTLNAIVEKRGMVVFVYETERNASMPDYSVRRKIERQISKSAREHIIIYVNSEKALQIWQWVKREAVKPTACREHRFYSAQPGDSLIQKIDSLVFTLEDEEKGLTVLDASGRARKAFDVEKITKRFYDHFKAEHERFSEFLKGIPDEKLQRWYVSVMLNRLMFIYFIQKKGFLDNDTNYLRSGLGKSKQYGKDLYYQNFLCPLFFEGFAKKETDRKPETNRLLGTVPYLNGGLFQQHQIEKWHGKEIQIEDATFENLFTFFDEYDWHLDERPRHADNEINPDVLGYIFEKYINQKQMGAYYTKEDITEYISKNTIIPFLFDKAEKKCKIAFEGEQSVWRLLTENPDRYIYDAVRKGVESQLPDEIAAGIKDVSKRTGWNKPASEKYALPTEIWREVVSRRNRYEKIWNKMVEGEVRSVNDLITYNLDIRQFAHDVIENCEGPELLRAIYYTIAGRIPEKSNQQIQHGISILDPTCGSGAFLFAALNILEPLYEACLDRMQVFLDELENSGQKHRSDKFGDFRKILEHVEQHPNRQYFILKSIILNNLYGVDIMEEAIEICKLRLFLKLVAQVDNVEKIEPLPDIDFNIRAGNTLVGFASRDEVVKAITTTKAGDVEQGRLLFGEETDTMRKLEENADIADRAFKRFREMQIERGMDSKDFADAKEELSSRLKLLSDELDLYLASEYGIVEKKKAVDDIKYQINFKKWRESHQPFHWFIEFYGIIQEGGFDVIIGNPPYVEYSKVKKEYTLRGYETERCGNLYALILERTLKIISSKKRIGVIIPLSFVSTDGFSSLRTMFSDLSLWVSNYAIRPAKLFEGVEHRLTIAIMATIPPYIEKSIVATRYRKWSQQERPNLLSITTYGSVSEIVSERGIPKLGSALEINLWKNIVSTSQPFKSILKNRKSTYCMYYTRKFGHFVLFTDFIPSIAFEDGSTMKPTELKCEYLRSLEELLSYIAYFNSTLTYWYLVTIADCRNLNKRDILDLPCPFLTSSQIQTLAGLGRDLMADFRTNASHIKMNYPNQPSRVIEVIHPGVSSNIIHKIDRVLAKHYGFTDDELDFIINYDIKYRMRL